MLVGDFDGAVDNLHRYFDYALTMSRQATKTPGNMSATPAGEYVNLDVAYMTHAYQTSTMNDRKTFYTYALINLAIVLDRFQDITGALQAIKECVVLARLHRDQACLDVAFA